MSRRPSARVPQPPVWSAPRSPLGGFPSAAFAAMVREHASLGERVRVRRDGFTFYDIVQNGSAFLVLPSMIGAEPIGTFDDVVTAILSGDRRVEAVRRGEFDAENDDGGDNWPRGAA